MKELKKNLNFEKLPDVQNVRRKNPKRWTRFWWEGDNLNYNLVAIQVEGRGSLALTRKCWDRWIRVFEIRFPEHLQDELLRVFSNLDDPDLRTLGTVLAKRLRRKSLSLGSTLTPDPTSRSWEWLELEIYERSSSFEQSELCFSTFQARSKEEEDKIK